MGRYTGALGDGKVDVDVDVGIEARIDGCAECSAPSGVRTCERRIEVHIESIKGQIDVPLSSDSYSYGIYKFVSRIQRISMGHILPGERPTNSHCSL